MKRFIYQHGFVLTLVLSQVVGVADRNAWAETVQDESAKLEFFEKKVRPILVGNCYNCHSADNKAAGGLRVDDINGLYHGGSSGPAVVPGDPGNSVLIQAVRYEGFEMPPKKKLSDQEIADLEQWVRDGAVGPKFDSEWVAEDTDEKYAQLREEHWSWQPLASVEPPQVEDEAWSANPIDRFLLASLEQRALAPVANADKLTLLRRVTFDLTGLPPSLEEIDAFLNDSAEDAFEKVVDRLLSSPEFGERWGRHWLDVARYAESTGSGRNVPYPQAWRYRDYVIESFNKDKPYDQFIREQIAGDLLPATSGPEKEEQLIATGFLALGVKDVNQRFKVRFVMDNIDEQIDTVSRSVLGLTVSCARCHDHKFDPVPTADYYALAGIFHSTDLLAGVRNKMGGGGLDYYDTDMLLNIDPNSSESSVSAEEIAEAKKKFENARAQFQKIRGTPEGAELAPNGRPKQAVARQRMNRLQQEYTALTDPAAHGKIALGVRDSKTIGDTEIRIRGEAEKLGPVVPRGFLSLIEVPNTPTIGPHQSGRLELAYWITSGQNPLTSRVVVNRIWKHLYGQGLVSTVDNFGLTGDKPSHPELLDYLANRFVSQGWSTKRLIREIILSRSYRLGSEATDAHLEIDPANRLVWRHVPRRLDAEEIRDAALAVTGVLVKEPAVASPAHELQVREIRNNGPEAKTLADFALASKHRSVYLPLLRGLTPNSLAVFDFAEQGMVTGARDVTTVAPQALYMLNDSFVLEQSRRLAEQLLNGPMESDDERVRKGYRITLGREPASHEVARVLEYLADYQQTFDSRFQVSLAVESDSVPPVGDPPVEESEKSETNNDLAAEAVLNPDDVEQDDLTVRPDAAAIHDGRVAAWSSFCQVLLGSGEFLYLR